MRILLVVHGLPPGATGGTEIYTLALADALAAAGDDEVQILARSASPERAELEIWRERRGNLSITYVNNTFAGARSFADTYRSPEMTAVVMRAIEDCAPDVVHVQHLTCLTTDLVSGAQRRGIPVVMTVNDYWLECHRGQLVDRDLARCDGPSPEGCGRCIGLAAGTVGRYRAAAALRWAERRGGTQLAGLGRWLRGTRSATPLASAAKDVAERRIADMRGLLADVSLFVAPSRTMRDRLVGFGAPVERVVVATQGIAARVPLSVEGRAAGQPRARGGPLRVGFFGQLIPSKAPHLVAEAVALLPPGRAELHVYGEHLPYHGDDGYQKRLVPLLERASVHHHGAIPHDDVLVALARLDVLCVPSVWIENAPFVIREAFASGLPVVASNLGGMAEMVEHEVSGLLFEAGDSTALAAALRRLTDEPELLPRLRRGIPAGISIEDDAAHTRALYRRLVGEGVTVEPRGVVRSGGEARPRTVAVVLNYRTPTDAVLCARSLVSSTEPPDTVLVVDNDSADGSAARLRESLPVGVELLETGANLGFSGGMNCGVEAALGTGAERLLLLNADVVLPADCVARLNAALDDNPELGVVGPVVLARADPERVASLGIRFDPTTGRMRQLGVGSVHRPEILASLIPCSAVSGCAMLLSRRTWDTVGGFDEALFFGFEDVDYGLRAARLGLGSAIVGDAVAYHEGGRSLDPRAPVRHYYGTRNHLRIAARIPAAIPGAGAARSFAIVTFNLAHALLTTPAPRWAALAAFGRGARDHLRGRYGPAPGAPP